MYSQRLTETKADCDRKLKEFMGWHFDSTSSQCATVRRSVHVCVRASNSIMFCCGREIFHIVFLIQKHPDLSPNFPCELVWSSAAVTSMRLEQNMDAVFSQQLLPLLLPLGKCPMLITDRFPDDKLVC